MLNWAVLWVLICTVHLNACSYHVTYAFQSESTICSCLNVKELLARSRRKVWSLSDCNWTRAHNHLVHKRKLNHLTKLNSNWSKWLWVQVQLQSVTYVVIHNLHTNIFLLEFLWSKVKSCCCMYVCKIYLTSIKSVIIYKI